MELRFWKRQPAEERADATNTAIAVLLGIALAVDMPHAAGRCYCCALVAFIGDASVAEYQRVVANIAAATASGGPTE